MTVAKDDDMICPQCSQVNPPKSSYCWHCRFDFRDDAENDPRRPKTPIPPPYSIPQARAQTERTRVTLFQFAMELVVSALIVGGSWYALHWLYPKMNVLMFAAGWMGMLALTVYSEGRLPDPETDWRKYYSMNPFNFEDDKNRFVLDWHITLFLPRIVLHTLRNGLAVIANR